MSWMNTKVLVTGAGGFIGSHLTERLVELGASVRAFVHYNGAGSWGWLDDSPHKDAIDIFSGDICDPYSVRHAVKDCEIIFHLAALIAIPYSYHAPASYVRTNVGGTLNVLQSARDFGVGRVLHTSTSEVYGTARYVPIDEGHPLQAQSPYSASKIGADKIAESFFLSFNTPVVTLRPFNTYGPRQSARAVIPTIITQLMSGGRIRLGNLHTTRDLNFVSNTVDGFVAAATASNVLGSTINLGSGREITVENLAKMTADLMGVPLAVEEELERVRPAGSEVERLIAANGLARQLLDWEPHIPLEKGLTQTIAWMRDHLHRYRPEKYTL